MISSVLHRIRQFAWLLPGFLLWASFPPMGEKGDVLFALAPLIWLSRRADTKTSTWRWFLNGLFFWIATLSWMPAVVRNGGPLPLVVLGWFCLAAYCAAFFAAYGFLISKFWLWAREGSYWRRLGVIFLAEPILWCGLELVRSRFLGGFAWNQLGVVPVNGGFGSPAAWGGVYLCSAVVILINGTLAGIAERTWRPENSGFPRLKKLGSLETLLAFLVVFAVYRLPTKAPDDSGREKKVLKAALVQRNFPCVFKTRAERPLEVYSRLLDNVSPLMPDLIVLPESAMCEFGPVDQQGAVRFAEWVSKRCGGAAVLAGGTRYADENEYNSAALFSFEGDSPAIEVYDKVHLVPFGEFIPLDKVIPALQKLAPVGSCTPGTLKTLRLGKTGIDAGVAICYEDTDSAQIRELVKKGARVLFFITNDSWFSHSIEAEQHSWQAVARAIETGVDVVRVGNSGVTGTIARDGRTSWLIGPNSRPLVDREGTMLDRLEIADSSQARPMTHYVRFGDVPLGVAFTLLILGLIMIKYRQHYEKRRSMPL